MGRRGIGRRRGAIVLELTSDAERVAFLVERYQALTSLLPVAKPAKRRRKVAGKRNRIPAIALLLAILVPLGIVALWADSSGHCNISRLEVLDGTITRLDNRADGRVPMWAVRPAELIHRRSWKNREAVELATLDCVHRFNHQRLLGSIGNIPPAENRSSLLSTTGRVARGSVTQTKWPLEFSGRFTWPYP